MNNLFSYSFIFMIIIVIIVSCMSSYTLDYSNYNINEDDIYISQSGFAWPIPGFTKISSYFGARNSPTAYASSFHYGLDIPTIEGTYFLSSISGTVIFAGFKGSGGYTIIVENNETRVIYCHVSPNFIVNVRRPYRTSTSFRTSSVLFMYMMY